MTRAKRTVAWWLAVGLAITALTMAPTVANAAEPDPVLLVHGYRGSATSLGELRTWLLAPAADTNGDGRVDGGGRTRVHTIQFTSQDNKLNAQAIANYATAQGWTRFDVVSHSMGGLSARWFAKFLNGAARIGNYVSLGAPQTGVYTACFFSQSNGGQMCPTSGFLRDLNSGDDTPGTTTAYTSIFSTSDEIVPYTRSRMDGGACHFQVSGLRHDNLIHSPAVTFPLVLAAIDDGADASCPVGGAWRP